MVRRTVIMGTEGSAGGEENGDHGDGGRSGSEKDETYSVWKSSVLKKVSAKPKGNMAGIFPRAYLRYQA